MESRLKPNRRILINPDINVGVIETTNNGALAMPVFYLNKL